MDALRRWQAGLQVAEDHARKELLTDHRLTREVLNMASTPKVASLLICATLTAFSVPAAAQGALGMAEVKALISGNTIHVETLSNGQASRSYFAPSGEIVVQRDDANEFSGYWDLKADGSLCVSFNDEACGTIARNADGSHTRNVRGVPTYKWTRIAPGKGF